MREITLNGLDLPNDLVWVNEFEYSPTAQQHKRTLNGALIINENVKINGRTITLDSVGVVWLSRAVVVSIKVLSDELNGVFDLVYHGASFKVRFDKTSNSSINAVPVLDCSDPSDAAPYKVTLNFIDVSDTTMYSGSSGGTTEPDSSNISGSININTTLSVSGSGNTN